MALLEITPGANIALVGISLICVLALLDWWQQSRVLATMPGPKGYPFVGIGLGMPPRAPEVFRQWAREFGEVFKIRIGWYNWVVINSPEAFKEILDKQVRLRPILEELLMSASIHMLRCTYSHS